MLATDFSAEFSTVTCFRHGCLIHNSHKTKIFADSQLCNQPFLNFKIKYPQVENSKNFPFRDQTASYCTPLPLVEGNLASYI